MVRRPHRGGGRRSRSSRDTGGSTSPPGGRPRPDEPEEDDEPDTGGTTSPPGGRTQPDDDGSGGGNGGSRADPRNDAGRTGPPDQFDDGGGRDRSDDGRRDTADRPDRRDRTGTGTGSSPPAGRAPPDGYRPDTGQRTSPTGGRRPQERDREPEELDPTRGRTSPTGGRTPSDGGGMDVPEGVSDRRATEMREEVASGDPAVFVTDVELDRRELTEEERRQLREEYAADREDVDADQVEFEEEPYEVVASVGGAGQERSAEYDAAQRYDVDPLEIDAEREESSVSSPVGGEPSPEGDTRAERARTVYRAEPLTEEAQVSIAAEQTEYSEDELSVEDGEVVVRDSREQRTEPVPNTEPIDAPIASEQPGEATGQTTATDMVETRRTDDGGLAFVNTARSPGPVEAAAGGAEAFFTDPYGSTVGYGVEDLSGNFVEEVGEAETAVSERAGFDVGRTASVTGETLADRPVDSFVTGVSTIRTGAAAAASDASGDTAAAGAMATTTGTGTGTAVVSGIGATTAAGALPVGSAVFGARGLQEENIALPTETAPNPGEDVNEVEPTRNQYPDEVQPERGATRQPEIEVNERTSAGATATEVPVDRNAFGGDEIEVGEDANPGATRSELPVGQGGATDEPATGTQGSVVPGDYPMAGRDFPADPSREYVPGQRGDLAAEAQTMRAGEALERRRRRDDDLYDAAEQITIVVPEEEVEEPEPAIEEDAYLEYLRGRQREAQRSEVRRGSQFRFPAAEVTATTVSEPLVEEAQRAAVTEQAGGQTQAPEDLFAADQQGEMTAQSEATQPGVAQEPVVAEATAADVAMAQENVYGQMFDQSVATEPAYPTEVGYGYGYGTGQGNSYHTPTPLPTPSFPSGDRRMAPDERGGQYSDDWVNPIAALGTGEFLFGGDEEWP